MDALYGLGGPAWTGGGHPVDRGVAHVLASLRPAEQLADRGAAWFAAAVHSMYATTLLAVGLRAEAIEMLERSLAESATHDTSAYRLRCLAPLAEATGSVARLEEAEAALRAIDRAWLYGADAYVSVARGWHAHGKPERAREILEPLLEASRRTGWLAPLAKARAPYRNCAQIAAVRPG